MMIYPVELILITPNKKLTERLGSFGDEPFSYDPKRYDICDFWVEAERTEGCYHLPYASHIEDIDLRKLFTEYPDALLQLCDEEGGVFCELTADNYASVYPNLFL